VQTEKNPMLATELSGLKLLHQGKVRDVYELPDNHVLLVATDRASAFDIVLPTGIPHKGEVLTQISAFWYEQTSDVIPNAFIAILNQDIADKFGVQCTRDYFGRSMVMKKTEVLKIEAVVRGYLSGSGWDEYKQNSSICAIELPNGLLESSQLVEPIFTPTTKAEPPDHDAHINYEQVEQLLGSEIANAVKLRALALYRYGSHYVAQQGLIIADTKFEFGLLNNEVTLIDEVMTPDSSRFWSSEQYFPGKSQESFDKQPLRDYLKNLDWNIHQPPPELPEEVVNSMTERYLQAHKIITGRNL
tara:strand:+ start:4193 stop:5098 length:906 start_codon:yes stop_codon:yes gene_type:complete